MLGMFTKTLQSGCALSATPGIYGTPSSWSSRTWILNSSMKKTPHWKAVVIHFVDKVPYTGTRTDLISALRTAHSWSLSWARLIQLTPPQPITLCHILILFCNMRRHSLLLWTGEHVSGTRQYCIQWMLVSFLELKRLERDAGQSSRSAIEVKNSRISTVTVLFSSVALYITNLLESKREKRGVVRGSRNTRAKGGLRR